VTTALTGTEAMMLDGTLSGTSDHETTTADGSDAMVKTTDDGSEATQVTGTTTGVKTVDGTVIVAGTVTNELAGTVTTADGEMLTITLDGTLFGTSFQETMTADGSEAIVITTDDGSEATNEIGTTTGVQTVDGTVTVAGAVTDSM